MQRSSHFLASAALVLAAAGLARSTQAAVIAYDPIQGGTAASGGYTTGTSIVTQEPDGLLGFSNSATWNALDSLSASVNFNVVASDIGTYTDSFGATLVKSSSGSQAVVDAFRTSGTSGHKRVQRSSNSAVGLGETFYFSVLMRITEAGPAFAYVGAGKTFGPGIGIDSNGRVSAASVPTGGTGTFGQSASSTALAVGQTHLLVGKVVNNGTTDQLQVFANPADLATEPLTPIATRSGDFVFPSDSLTSIGFFAIAANGDSVLFDEFRVGDTWADVTPNVPEPASLACLGVAATLLGRRRHAQARV